MDTRCVCRVWCVSLCSARRLWHSFRGQQGSGNQTRCCLLSDLPLPLLLPVCCPLIIVGPSSHGSFPSLRLLPISVSSTRPLYSICYADASAGRIISHDFGCAQSENAEDLNLMGKEDLMGSTQLLTVVMRDLCPPRFVLHSVCFPFCCKSWLAQLD